MEDLQAVERAFNDLHRKYERTKEVVAGFKANEDTLKKAVEDLGNRSEAQIQIYDHEKCNLFAGTKKEKRDMNY